MLNQECGGQTLCLISWPRKLACIVFKREVQLHLLVITDLCYESLGLLLVNAFLSSSVMWQNASTSVHCWTACVLRAAIFKIWVCRKSRRKKSQVRGKHFKTSAWRAKKLLQLQPCKTMVVHALKEHDLVRILHIYSQFLQSAHIGEAESLLVFFFLLRPGFHYLDRWILRTASTGVQKIQNLFTNSLVMMNKLVFDVQWVQAMRCQQFLGKNSIQQIMCSASTLTVLSQEGNIFQHLLSHHWVIIRLSEGYYYSKSFSCFLHWLLNFPMTQRLWCNTSGLLGRCL